MGPEPLGKSRADAHVRCRDGLGGSPAYVPRDTHKAASPRRRLESPREIPRNKEKSGEVIVTVTVTQSVT
jgi:hypothetical protein